MRQPTIADNNGKRYKIEFFVPTDLFFVCSGVSPEMSDVAEKGVRLFGFSPSMCTDHTGTVGLRHSLGYV
jgi:hypothetical protein